MLMSLVEFSLSLYYLNHNSTADKFDFGHIYLVLIGINYRKPNNEQTNGDSGPSNMFITNILQFITKTHSIHWVKW
jgi:hypothetical protein